MRRLMLLMGALVVTASVVVMAAAGSAGGGEAHSSASALPSGEIVFTRRAGNSSNLYVMAPDGAHVRRLLRDASNAAVSRDGRRVAFVRAGAIWLMQRDGSGQRQLTHPPTGKPDAYLTGDYDPAWSSDGHVVYFSRRETGHPTASVFSVHPDGSGLRRLTRAPTDTGRTDEGTCQEQMAPSPDGRLVVYIAVAWCSHGLEASIEAITSAGRAATLPFTLPPTRGESYEEYSNPAWAQAGDTLAYTVSWDDFIKKDSFAALYLSGTNGSKPRRLVLWQSAPIDWINGVAWSPDGNWLVLARGNKDGIWIVRRDGTGLRRITHTHTDDSDPAWLPPAA